MFVCKLFKKFKQKKKKKGGQKLRFGPNFANLNLQGA